MSGEGEVWCVLTMKDGVVSLLKGLTENECRAVVQRVRGGNPWSQEQIRRKVFAEEERKRAMHLMQQQSVMRLGVPVNHIYMDDAPDPDPGFAVSRCEWWGSEGSQLEIWPKPDDYDARFAEAMSVADLVNRTNEAVSAKAA